MKSMRWTPYGMKIARRKPNLPSIVRNARESDWTFDEMIEIEWVAAELVKVFMTAAPDPSASVMGERDAVLARLSERGQGPEQMYMIMSALVTLAAHFVRDAEERGGPAYSSALHDWANYKEAFLRAQCD